MANENRTAGELLLEKYLRNRGLPFEYEKRYDGKTKLIDYTVPINGRDFLFEVKQFDPVPVAMGSSVVLDPYGRIREKLDDAGKQFSQYKGHPCVLVLVNNGQHPLFIEHPVIMSGVMYGDAGFVLNFDPVQGRIVGDPEPQFLGHGKMIRPHWKTPANRRISAIITLRQYNVGLQRVKRYLESLDDCERRMVLSHLLSYDFPFDTEEREVCALIWENYFAEVPFPRNVFCGPYDQRWGIVDQHPGRLFCGEGIREFEPDTPSE
jgi:hypothetical protein